VKERFEIKDDCFLARASVKKGRNVKMKNQKFFQ